jgi:hypothetical protein
MRPGEQPPADVLPEVEEDTTEVIEIADRDGGAERVGGTDTGSGMTPAGPAAPETPSGA